MFKKLLIDLIMFIIFAFLMSLSLTGSFIHELMGIVILIIVIIHLLFNMMIIKSILLKFKNMLTNYKFNILLDLVILIDLLVIIITGIMISQSIFTFISINNISLWSSIHHFSAYLGICLIGIHIGLHLNPIIKYIESKLKINKFKYKNIGYTLLSLIIICNGIYNIIKPAFYKNFIFKKEVKQQDNSSDSNDSISSITNDNQSSSITLQEYLKDLHCNGCSRHCSLANPLCNRSAIYIEEATAKYNSIYNNTSMQSLSNDVTLQEYLSDLNCSGCPNNCSLANVKCDVGVSAFNTATDEYNKTYNSSQVIELENDNINLFGYMSIISFFAIGTHWTIKIINKNNKIK